MTDAKLNAELDRAFTDLLRRYKFNSDSEPYMLFAALALEQDRLVQMVGSLEDRVAAVEKAIKPKLIIPAVAPQSILGGCN
jgi:translation elongation factor EF-Tu-like GTPase